MFCDIKRPLAGQSTPSLDESSYRAVIRGFKVNLGCNGIRIYIDPAITDPTRYPTLYVEAVHYARSLGLSIYANPLGVGSFGMDNATYASWIASYANHFQPRYLGPFNESGHSAADFENIVQNIVQRLRPQLTYAPQLVGPDKQKVAATLATLDGAPELPGSFDIFGAHDANLDDGATADAWTRLHATVGGTTWATENPRAWSEHNAAGDEVGVSAVVSAPISAVTLYLAFPKSVAADGNLTDNGRAIAAGIHR